MRKWIIGIIILIMLLVSCMGSPQQQTSSSAGTAAVQAGATNLDWVIRDASDYLNGRVPQGNKAVFLNVTSDWPDLSEYILSLLSENAVNDLVFSVVDRAQLDAVRAELNFQWSGEVSDASAQSIGEMLGAQTIVSGSVNRIGTIYRLQVRAIEVQTAAVQGQWSQTVNGSEPLVAALTQKVVPAAAASTVRTAATTTTATAPAAAAAPAQTTTQSAGAREQPAPIVVERVPTPATPAAPQNGTYTFYPRLRAHEGGVEKNSYIDRIMVRSGYLTIYLVDRPLGRGNRADSSYGWSGMYSDGVILQDLDRPSRSYNVTNRGTDEVTGGDYIVFQNVVGNRFRLTQTRANPPAVFDEIILGTPDR